MFSNFLFALKSRYTTREWIKGTKDTHTHTCAEENYIRAGEWNTGVYNQENHEEEPKLKAGHNRQLKQKTTKQKDKKKLHWTG